MTTEQLGAKPTTVPRILVVGGGYVGMYTALNLQKKLSRREAQITVVDPRPYMTYQPFLPEAAAGSLEPRHVVVPLRRALRRCEVITAAVTSIDHETKTAQLAPATGEPYELSYDIVVVALGSVARTLPIPGLAEAGIGFKYVEESVALRNHVLSRLDAAASTSDPDVRRRALTFVFVGGGYAGVEALGELENMAQYAIRYYPQLRASDMRWVLVEAAKKILPEVGPEMGVYTVEELSMRGIEIRLETFLESCVDGEIKLSKGKPFQSDTLVWTAGVKAHPMLKKTGLPLDERGRLKMRADLRVDGVEDAWGAGDATAVPDLTADPLPDGSRPTCAPNAQHAVRQARHLAKNIVASVRGEQVADYKHSYVGSVASLGLYKGVAHVYGIKVKGLPAWFMHRAYHMAQMPTFARKMQVLLDWGSALFFRREVVSLDRFQHPRGEFERASSGE